MIPRAPAMTLKEAMERVLRRAEAARDGTPGVRPIEQPSMSTAEAMRIVLERNTERRNPR